MCNSYVSWRILVRCVVNVIPLYYIYRPQRSCGQGNVFTGVCLSTGGEGVCLSACWDTSPPPGPGRHPRDQADPPRPGRHPPGTRHTPPRTRQIPPQEADCSRQSTSGRYASYCRASSIFSYFSRPPIFPIF